MEKTKQSKMYEEYLNSKKSVKEIAEEFGVKYGTAIQMLHKERVKRGVNLKQRR